MKGLPVLPIAHVGQNVPSLYEGVCPSCDESYSVRLVPAVTSAPTIPPPSIIVGCQCRQPPRDVRLVYKGATVA